MKTRSHLPRGGAFILLMGMIIVACGPRPKSKTLTIPFFTQFKNVQEADEATRKSAQAIVRINDKGSGFFINGEGMLMTNHHVLGPDACFLDGCNVQLDFNYELGRKFAGRREVYAVPLVVSKELDVAVFQVSEKRAGQALRTPHFLELESESQEERIGLEVMVIGHPEAGLKKFFQTSILQHFGTWFMLDKPVLGGNSGSPVLSESGKVVGIIHSGSEVHDGVTRNDVTGFSLATDARAITDLLDNGLHLSNRDSLIEFKKFLGNATDAAEFASIPSKFTNRRLRQVMQGEKSIHPGRYLIDNCAEQVRAGDLNGDKATDFCLEAIAFVSCDKLSKFCPDQTEKAKWVSALDRYLDQRIRIFGPDSIYIYTVARAIGDRQVMHEAKSALQYVSKKYKPELSGPLVLALAFSATEERDLTYRKQSVVEFLLKYEQSSANYVDLESIWSSGITLFERGLMTEDEVNELFHKLLNDKRVALGERLAAEAATFEAGLL